MRHFVLTAAVAAIVSVPSIASAGFNDAARVGGNAVRPSMPRQITPTNHTLTGSAREAVITLGFEDLALGATLGSQYAAQGVEFSPDPIIASDTDLTVVSSTGSDVGALGTPALVSGNIIRSFNGWFGEADDPNLQADFSVLVSSVSVTLAGNGSIGVAVLPSELAAFDAAGNLLDDAIYTPTSVTSQGILTVSSTTPIASVVLFPGEFNDWVGFDNFSFTTVVPEPMSLGAVALGGLVMGRRRR